ncbi:hypothetical protein [Sphingomonas sp. Leaf38]|uniref:hypothetical protein n=1 Tax=Sphingomonas sp. Leaf38 TaxID=1736217 RepID=UPI00070019B8|nr:hypothetical protein [Sphingomonas sp. Leaf38]KQN33617.1 hypothetical protein ASE88_00870 [Sphingomonas sp. Leaf38]
MSKRLDVLIAVKDLIELALPGAKVLGLDGKESPPATIPAAGMVIVRTGDPGEPEYTFSPLTYFYDHRIPIEVSTTGSPGISSEQALDEMLVAIGEGIALDRTLGGLCDWLDTSSAGTEDIYTEGGGQPPRGAELMIIASYSTTNPLA